jgi:hypothetical protein
MMRGIYPDLVIVDYADLIKSMMKEDNKRFQLEEIYEDLRGIAGDFDVPVVTATQSQRGAAEEEIIGIEAIAESYLKAAVSDTIISLSRKVEDMALGTGKLYFAKSRSGISGVYFDVTIDTATSTICIINDEAQIPQKKSNARKIWNEQRNEK